MTRTATARETRQQARARIVAATERLVRRRSYGELSVDEVMREAGIGRTLFYRHFDDLADLLQRVARDAIEELYRAQLALAQEPVDSGPAAVRSAIGRAVDVYARHGPVLRAVAEAAAAEDELAAGYAALRRRFDELVERRLRALADAGAPLDGDLAELARALNLMNEAYLLDVFGHEPRVSAETAIAALSDIWSAVIATDRP